MVHQTIYLLGVTLFALAGLILSTYIYKKKRKKQKLVCPMRGQCDAVVQSRFSKFLGVPVELLGIFYYMFILLAYGLAILIPDIFSDITSFILTGITVGAFFFSIYLVSIQAFILKKWCTWCLFSAGFSTVIFLLAIFGLDIDLVALLKKYRTLIIIVHALSAALGIGAATITDISFFKFLKDYRISKKEDSVMHMYSNIIWVALGLLVLTGIGLFIQNKEALMESSKFLVKVVAVGVVIVNGVVLNLFISPYLTAISFGEKHDHHKGELKVYRKIAFASGGVSFVSWYTIFILGSLKSIPVTFHVGLLMYIGLLIMGIAGGQIYDKILFLKKNKDSKDHQ